MKLDFSALTQSVGKARGQVGTTGTPVSARVCATPLVQPGAGTTGDKPAAAVLAADLVVADLVACPPVSPGCPQVADAEKLNAGAASPVSPLVPIEAAQVAAAAPFERQDPAGKSPGASANICGDCLHLLRRGTCGEPVAAGLLDSFGIVWPPDGHGAGCAAFTGKVLILGRKLGLSDEQLMGTAEKAAGLGGADEQGPPQPGDADPGMGGASLSSDDSDGGQSMPPNPDDMRKGVM